MKRVIALLAIVGFAACNGGTKTTTTDSTTVIKSDTVKTTIMDTSKAAMDSMKKATDTTKKM